MIIGKTAVALAAIFLVTIINGTKAEARLNEFCEARYCGQQHEIQKVKVKKQSYQKHSYKKKFKSKKVKAVAHSLKKKKPIQVASLGGEPLREAPTASGLLAKASSYLGGNPTGWRSLWCARFIAMIAPTAAETLKRMGLNPNWARDYARLPGSRKNNPKPGDIVVLTRGNGGHIGIFKKFGKNGKIVIVSGNHGKKVGEGAYPSSRLIAYVTL